MRQPPSDILDVSRRQDTASSRRHVLGGFWTVYNEVTRVLRDPRSLVCTDLQAHHQEQYDDGQASPPHLIASLALPSSLGTREIILEAHGLFSSAGRPMTLRQWLGALGVSGRALVASLFTAMMGVISGFSVHRLTWCKGKPGGAFSTSGASSGLCAFPASIFHELDRELTDSDVRDLCWAVFSPSLLRLVSIRSNRE